MTCYPERVQGLYTFQRSSVSPENAIFDLMQASGVVYLERRKALSINSKLSRITNLPNETDQRDSSYTQTATFVQLYFSDIPSSRKSSRRCQDAVTQLVYQT